jgi:signal transduction histidine kinase
MAGVAVAITSIWLAWRGPAFSFAATSPSATIAELAAGWALIATGIAARRRRPASPFGWILTVAGLAWFLTEWPNPASAGSLIFSVGLIFHVAYPALIAHAAIAFPDAQLRAPIIQTVVAAAYLTNIVVLGLLPTLLFEPGSARCPGCPDNIFAFGSNIDVVTSATRLGFVLEVAWIAASIGLMIDRLVRATAASRRLIAPVLLPAMAFLFCVASDAIHSFERGNLSNDALELGLWFGQAIAIIAMAAGVELEGVRARRARQQVAQIVVDLTASPPAGHLRDRLAATLGDPRLGLAYAVSGGRLSDANGHVVEVVPEEGRTETRVERGTDLVAVVSHRTDLLDDPERLHESIAAARLAVENERLHAETQVQLEDLRASRVRIIDTADRERRRLERDLHDGAQQRLVHLSIAVGLARLRRGDHRDGPQASRLAGVDVELRQALAALREVAHGIYPTELADGLAAGVAVLADGAPIPLQINSMPETRLDPRVEAAAYFLIAQATIGAGARKATVHVDRRDDRLIIDIDVDGPPPANVVGLEDRVGALDGTVSIRLSSGGHHRIHAEIPCGS